jgi:glycosyltransferase involved in cell wall biosynthesis
MPEDDAHSRVTLVVPCFNEVQRLDDAEFLRLAGSSDAASRFKLLFVNDGSTDGTSARLMRLAARDPAHVEVLELGRNLGKGEAVRRGMLRALADGADIVGFLDADLSVPVEGMLELLEVLRTTGAQVVLGARVTMLGREIERKAVRHYLGRVFASVASLALGIRVYDTQCGGKLFRRGPALHSALAAPFISRWVFDVELIGRLLTGEVDGKLDVGEIVEHPLRVWREKPGSKLKLSSMVGAAGDLSWVAVDLLRRRKKL